MKTLILFLSLLSSSALALPGRVPAPSRVYATADAQGAVMLSLEARTPVEIRRCTPLWCSVSTQGKVGWIPRKQVKAQGNCAGLIAVGLRDLRPGEASYSSARDRDGDGLGCDVK